MTHFQDNQPAPAHLSRAGVERRERLLSDLHAELDRRVARRRRVRTLGAALGVVVVLGVAWASLTVRTGSGVVPAVPIAGTPTPREVGPAPVLPSALEPKPAPSPAPSSVVTIVRTDPDIVRRFAIAPGPSSIEIISDSALQHELTAAGLDPGLVTINGRTTITLAAATDTREPVDVPDPR